MTYRSAAEKARQLCFNEDARIAKLGLSILTELAEKDCYLARLTMMYLYDRGGLVEADSILAQRWADRAKEMQRDLIDPEDLYDAGMKCMWESERFGATRQEALFLWAKAAALGSGEAMYAICDATRHSDDRPEDWIASLETAAKLGSVQAMVELAEQAHIRGTAFEILWLRAAASLGSLRAKEMIG